MIKLLLFENTNFALEVRPRTCKTVSSSSTDDIRSTKFPSPSDPMRSPLTARGGEKFDEETISIISTSQLLASVMNKSGSFASNSGQKCSSSCLSIMLRRELSGCELAPRKTDAFSEAIANLQHAMIHFPQRSSKVSWLCAVGVLLRWKTPVTNMY